MAVETTIYSGSTKLDNAYLGTIQLEKIYLGTNLIYDLITKLATVTDVSTSGKNVTFMTVADATRYNVKLDGKSIGKVEV